MSRNDNNNNTEAAMQSLLSALMRLEDVQGLSFRTRGRNEANAVVQKISSNNESMQMQGLVELCDLLNMTSQDSPLPAHPNTLVPPILKCLSDDQNPELALMAARALTYLTDAMPLAASSIASNGGIPILLGRLRSVMFVEVSEQCMSCVEKMVTVQANTLVSEGAISAMLGYVDFFSISTQRKAWECTVTLCKLLKGKPFELIEGVLPQINQTLRHDDGKVREQCISALSNILASYSSESNLVAQVFSVCGGSLMSLLEMHSDEATFLAALSALSVGVKQSPEVSKTMIEAGIVEVLLNILHGSIGGQGEQSLTSPLMSPALQAQSGYLGAANMLPPPAVDADGNEAVALPGSIAERTAGTPLLTATPALSAARQPLKSSQLVAVCEVLAGLLPSRAVDALIACDELKVKMREEQQEAVASHRRQVRQVQEAQLRMRVQPGSSEVQQSLSQVADPEVYAQPEDSDEDSWEDVEDEDDEDGDEDDEMEGDNEESALSRSAVLTALGAKGVVFHSSPRHGHVSFGNHLCDGCSQTVDASNWYRCNQCADFDLCGKCLLAKYDDHVRENPGHNFCDMLALLTETISPLDADAKKGVNPRDVDIARMKLMNENPRLLEVVLTALPAMVQLCNDTEDPALRERCVTFLMSSVGIAKSSQLAAAHIPASGICDLLCTLLRNDEDLVAIASALFIIEKLLQKCNSRFQSLFIREGVQNALLKSRKMPSNQKHRHSHTAKAPTVTTGTEEEGHPEAQQSHHTGTSVDAIISKGYPTYDLWKTAIRRATNCILARFPSTDNTQATAILARIASLLQSGELQNAFAELSALLATDVSPFQLASSNIIPSIVTALQQADSVEKVMDLVMALAEERMTETTPQQQQDAADATVSPTLHGASHHSCKVVPLTRLVHHLQGMLNHREDLRVPILPLPPNRPHMLVELVEDTSSSPSSSSNRVRVVMADATESVGRIAEFILSKVLPSSSVGTPMGNSAARRAARRDNQSSSYTSDNEDNSEDSDEEREDTVVEQILPNAGDTAQNEGEANVDVSAGVDVTSYLGALEESAALVEESGVKRLHMRYGNQELRDSMTLAQVWMMASPSERDDAASKGTTNISRFAGLQLGMGLNLIHSSSEETKLCIHYSVKPFDPSVRPLSYVDPVVEVKPVSGVDIVLPSSSTLSSAERSVLRCLHPTFKFSNYLLDDKMRSILTLLGTVHETLTMWADLLKSHMAKRKATSANTTAEKPAPSSVFAVKRLSELPESVLSPPVHLGEFVNNKMDSKAIRQSLPHYMAGQHRMWWFVKLALDCNFLFSSATRRKLFHLSFCGKYRSLQRIQELRDGGSSRQSRAVQGLIRKKVRVWRNRPIACAVKVMCKQPTRASHTRRQDGISRVKIPKEKVLEFEFYNEAGSGLGPTLEFYSLVSTQLRKRALNLWRMNNEEDSDTSYRSEWGLYPNPTVPKSPDAKRATCYFHFIGRFLGHAILDRRIPALDLSPTLIKLLRNDEVSLDDLRYVASSVGETLQGIVRAALLPGGSGGMIHVMRNGRNYEQADASPTTPSEAGQASGASTKRSPDTYNISELLLDFTLPGNNEIDLIPNGASIDVDEYNMLQYCDCVVDFILREGIEEAVYAMRRGFHDVFPLCALKLLSVEELHDIILGYQQTITKEEFAAHCVADHGFTKSSTLVLMLFDVLGSFTLEEQRRFFEFLTGSPHLPVGGLANLQPRITIVRKTPGDDSIREEDQLPSAMTCQNYLKVPAYDTRELLEKKLRQAINEGCGSFMLT